MIKLVNTSWLFFLYDKLYVVISDRGRQLSEIKDFDGKLLSIKHKVINDSDEAEKHLSDYYHTNKTS